MPNSEAIGATSIHELLISKYTDMATYTHFANNPMS